ncbi:class I SAM-dependent methyltransferase [Arthrobacter sp. 7Tela_A1]|uniref:class I SAM-dependent methyltransferase n=1 Tax=Arthrobacter sp. 7Tela_A1 TaxID=3093745 RepID=UPI003BB7BFA6
MAAAPATAEAQIHIDQRGRSELAFLRQMRGGLTPLRQDIRAALESAGVLAGDTVQDISALRREAEPIVANLPEHRVVGSVLRWCRDQTTPRAVAAFERCRDELEPLASVPDHMVEDLLGPEVPRYWDYEFHGTAGGWDGHGHMGFIHFELVYKYLLMAAYGNGIFALRKQVAAAAPRGDYQRILDLGAGTGQYTMMLAEVYPEAQITALDPSRTSLNYAKRRSLDAGLDWRCVRSLAERTGLPDASFDLVTSFILLHEVPPHITRAILAESFRLLEPGGEIHFSDVTPYRACDPYKAWNDDWDAEHGNEPWWRTAATAELTALAEAAGFTEVREGGLPGGGVYPWILTARKPLETA